MIESFTVNSKYVWFNDGKIIVKMYFLNEVPFTFDDLEDGHLYDRELVEEATKNDEYDIYDVYRGSNYLMMEECHPCFDNIKILNPSVLPEDLVSYFDEEDLMG